MRARTLSLVFFLVWWSGIFLAPVLQAAGGDSLFLYKIYSQVCHQSPQRSFFLLGEKLGVCSRCTGIYTGALFFSLLSFKFRPPLRASSVGLLLSPLILGKFMEKLTGFSSNWERFFTGLFPGILLGMGLLYGLEDLERRKNEGRPL